MIVDFDETETWLTNQFKLINPSKCAIAFSGGDSSKATLTLVLRSCVNAELSSFPIIVFNKEIKGQFDENMAIEYVTKLGKLYELQYKIFDTTQEMFAYFEESNIENIFMGQRVFSPRCEASSQVDFLRDVDGNPTNYTIINPLFFWKLSDIEKYNVKYQLDINLEDLSIQ
jgi:tRNA(Ile)-lysidine synthase TilS/MesJ